MPGRVGVPEDLTMGVGVIVAVACVCVGVDVTVGVDVAVAVGDEPPFVEFVWLGVCVAVGDGDGSRGEVAVAVGDGVLFSAPGSSSPQLMSAIIPAKINASHIYLIGRRLGFPPGINGNCGVL